MNKLTRILLACVCLGVAAMGSSPAFAAKKKKAKSHRVAKQGGGSSESTSDRDRRLKRECRGQVNAGACAGYTR